MSRRRQTVIDQQTAPLRFELLSVMHQLLALTRNMSGLFFFFARHTNHRQLPSVTFHITREALTQGQPIARISLYPSTLLIEFTRRNGHSTAPRALSTLDGD